MNAGSSNNDLISRITVKFTWKPGGFNRYFRCQFKQSNTRINKSRFHPFVNSAVQGKFFRLHKLGNFPT
uniref:Uncharacterized protein n=1 Tax=Candidatus Kentrum sp. LPFa TaxID=2126335 RepID=A0A450X2T6_9GAMM|nr:MAG: hypothetical protein BECKLPF1236B_GA0070989_13651 [Candidatus Kentron sp. LPFa]